MTTIETAITAVTVYPSQARVVRHGTATLTANGAQTGEVHGLPENIDADSVRASAQGPPGLTVTGVDLVYGSARTDGAIEALRTTVEGLEDDWRAAEDAEAVITEEIDQIARMRRANAKRLVDPDTLTETEAVATTLSERSTASRSRRREVGGSKRLITRRLDAARAALAAAEGEGRERATRQVVIGLDAAEPGDIEISVTYVVWGASWQPLYDVRLVEDQVTLGYLASVQQTSGEDWPAVPLTLSTARPGLTGTLPDPDPWYVDLPRPIVAHRGMRPMAMPAPAGAVSSFAAASDSTPPTMVDADVDQALVDESATARVFRAARPVAVGSDGSVHRVGIATLDLPAQVDHVCAPRSSGDVHVRATVTNASAVTLLPGTAAVFRGDEFVGRTQLDLVAPGEEIELHLGIEDRIDVERELVRRDARRAGLIGSTGRVVLAYQTTIISYLTASARLLLIDQVPVAKDPSISIKIGTVRPAPTRTDQLGRYEWEIDLAPSTPTVIMIDFSVEGPRDKPVVGLGA